MSVSTAQVKRRTRAVVGGRPGRDHDDVEVMDPTGKKLAAARLPEGVAGSPRCTS